MHGKIDEVDAAQREYDTSDKYTEDRQEQSIKCPAWFRKKDWKMAGKYVMIRERVHRKGGNTMDMERFAKRYWKCVADQDRTMEKCFSEDAVIRWQTTDEEFTVADLVEAHCQRPGRRKVVIERMNRVGETLVTVVHLWMEGTSYYVTSFFQMHRGRIVQLDEYWGENIEAPQWRTEAQIGTRIDRRRKKRKAEAPAVEVEKTETVKQAAVEEKTAAKFAEINYTYLLRCADGSLYAGWTNDIEKRLAAHQSGKGAKYTKAHLPVELVYHESFATKEEAMRREYELKQMTKAQKEALVQSKSENEN